MVGEALLARDSGLRLAGEAAHVMPSRTPPNPSIAGAVDFIESEARRVTPLGPPVKSGGGKGSATEGAQQRGQR